MSKQNESASSSALSKLSDNLAREVAPESTIEHLPRNVVSDLLGGAITDSDPASRDFGERYEYRNILGEGGQGVVVTAHDLILDRDVAVKALKQHGHKVREEYLEREAKLSGILEHPNIPPTYDLGYDEAGSPFFVMRKVEGTSLDEVMAESHSGREGGKVKGGERRLSRLRLLSIFDQICHAIEYAHSRGILHLDIKPQNIKLGPYGEVFVLDWGFAARKNEPPKVVGGTPIYIALERLRHEAPDERADIYSLGILLYRMLTNKRPFNVKNLSFKDYREQYDTLEQIPPRTRDSSIPPELDAIVMKAIAKDPAARYQRAHDLAQDLQRFLDGVPVTAYQTGLLRRGWKTIRRHSVISSLVTALLIAGAGTALFAYRSHKAEAERQIIAAREQEAIAARREAEKTRATASIPYEKGRALVDKNPPHYEGARAFFSKAILLDPTYAEAFFERGKTNMKLRAMNEALSDFRQAIDLDPNRIMAHYHSGIIQMDVFKDNAVARREFEAMQQIDPDNEYSNLGLARLRYIAGRYEEALKLCERIEERNPSLSEVHYLRGLIYGQQDKSKAALAAYDRYLENPSDHASAYSNRGLLRQKLGDVEGALADYNEALNINPDNVYALNNRGFLYYAHLNKPEAAMTDFNHAARANPEHHWTYINRGAVHEAQKQWTQAEEDYNWARDLRPDDPMVMMHMGECLFRQAKFAHALEYFDRAARQERESLYSLLSYRRGLALYAMGEWDKSLAAFENSLRQKPSRPFYPAMMAHICRFQRGENPNPEKLLAYAEANPDRPWLAAAARYWQGLITENQAVKSAELPEARCELHYYLGMFQLLVFHDTDKASKHFNIALETKIHLRNEYVLAGHEVRGIVQLIKEDGIANETGAAGKDQ